MGAQDPFDEFTLVIKVKRKPEIKQVIYDFEAKVSHMISPILSSVLGSIFFLFLIRKIRINYHVIPQRNLADR